MVYDFIFYFVLLSAAMSAISLATVLPLERKHEIHYIKLSRK
jgi:type IV secretory pathway component VirB8